VSTQTVSVDFDGPIHLYSRGWADGSIYDGVTPGAFQSIKGLQAYEVAVVIWTVREPGSVISWLAHRGGFECVEDDGREFHNDVGRLLVTSRKLPSVAYIDDRGVHWVSWPQTMFELGERFGMEMGDQSS